MRRQLYVKREDLQETQADNTDLKYCLQGHGKIVSLCTSLYLQDLVKVATNMGHNLLL